MKIEIQSHNFLLTGSNEDYIRNSLISGLVGNQADIDTVQIWLADISPGESARVVYCLVDVKLFDGSSVIGDWSDTQLHVAIHCAIDGVSSKLLSSVGQLQVDSHHYQPGKPEVQYSQAFV